MDNWKKCTLSDLGEIVGGATPSTKNENYYGGDIAWITPKDLSTFQERYISRGERNITKEGLKNSSARLMPPCSVLFTSRAPIGYVAIAKNEVCTNQGFKSIVPNTETDYLFLYYLLVYNRNRIENMGSGTTFKEVSGAVMKQIEVFVPSKKAEQETIASILGALDDKIELNTKINHHLEQMAQAIYKSWFVDFEPWGGIMPEDWRIEKLGNLCQSISQTHTRNKEELIFLNTGDIDRGLFLHSTYSKTSDMPGQAKKSIALNDILYSEIRPINKHYAYVSFDAPDYIVSTKLMVIRATDIDNRRLYHYLTSQDIITELQIEAESRSGTFPQIRFENIQNMNILLATPEVEEQFSTILKDIYATIELNNAESANLATLRDTLLPRLMSGELSGELSVADIQAAK